MNRRNALPHLPEETIEEILSSLPVKSLLRFRCVSKSWRSLVDSKRFIETQLEKSRKNPNSGRWQVLFNCNSENPVPGLKRCSKQSYTYNASVDLYPVDDPIINHHTIDSKFSIVGHCNGLLCIFKQPRYFFLWNPTTRISIELPKLKNLIITNYGFGWDKQSDAYKVFAIVYSKYKSKFTGRIYSSKTNSWKRVKHQSVRSYKRAIGMFADGKIHWLIEGASHTEYLDLVSEVFGVMELPVAAEAGTRIVLTRINEFLALVSHKESGSDVWIMMNGRWAKHTAGPDPSLQGFYMVLTTTDGVKFLPREKIAGCVQCCSYIESLVSPVPDKYD